VRGALILYIQKTKGEEDVTLNISRINRAERTSSTKVKTTSKILENMFKINMDLN
jgi:hypothetical protein